MGRMFLFFLMKIIYLMVEGGGGYARELDSHDTYSIQHFGLFESLAM